MEPAVSQQLRDCFAERRLIPIGQETDRHCEQGAEPKQRTLSLTCEEFLRRFLQHVLPKGFPRIRHFGWLAITSRW
jgi:hypothetical protein